MTEYAAKLHVPNQTDKYAGRPLLRVAALSEQCLVLWTQGPK